MTILARCHRFSAFGKKCLFLITDSLFFCDYGGHIVLPGRRFRLSACTGCQCQTGERSQDCKTLRVRNCQFLTEEVGRGAVKVDASCASQCPKIVDPSYLISV